MLVDCLKKLGKQIPAADREEITDAFEQHRGKGLGEHEAGLEALYDYHQRLHTETNELRRAAGLKPVAYERPQSAMQVAEPQEATPADDIISVRARAKAGAASLFSEVEAASPSTTVPLNGKVVQKNETASKTESRVNSGNGQAPLRSVAVPTIERDGRTFEQRPVLISELIKRDGDLKDFLADEKNNPPAGKRITDPIVVGLKPRGGVILDGMRRVAQAISNGQRMVPAYVQAGVPSLLSTIAEHGKRLEELKKASDFRSVVPEVKTSTEGNVLKLDSPEAAETVRTLLAFVNGTSRDEQPIIDGVFLEPKNVEKFRAAADAFEEATKERGIDTQPLKDLIANIDEAAKQDGSVQIGDSGHEKIHHSSWLASGGKPLEERYDGAADQLKNDDAFQTFHGTLNALQGESSHGVALEEALAYLGSGQHEEFGLDENQTTDLLATLVHGYAEANGVESLKSFAPNTDLYEAIENHLANETDTPAEGSVGVTGDAGGSGLDSEREAGSKTPTTESQGDAQEPDNGKRADDAEAAEAEQSQVSGSSGTGERAVSGDLSSIQNSEVDAAREKRGWQKLSPKLRQSNPDLHERVQQIVATDPDAPLRTFEKFNEHPKAVPTDEENVLLNAHYIDVKRDWGQMVDRYTTAMDSGDPLEMTNARMDRKIADAKLDSVENVLRRTGTESGRSLQSRQMAADEDFEFARLVKNYKVAKGAEPSSTELQQLRQIAEDHKARSEALEAALAGKDEELADIKGRIPSRHILDIAENYVKKLDTRAEAARKRLQQRGAVFTAGLDPFALKDLAEVGASHLAHLGLDFAKWSDRMASEFGERVRPHLADIYAAAQKIVDGSRVDLRSDADKMATALKSQKTRMENRISELEKAITDKERIVRNRSAVTPDAELEGLKQRAASLKEDYDAVFPRTGRPAMTDAQRLQALEKRLGKKQDTLQQKIQEGDLSDQPKRQPIDPSEIRQDTSGKYTAEDKERARRVLAAQAEVGKIEKRYARMKAEAEKAAEPITKWGMRKATNFVRASMLSALTVVQKLGAASIGRTVTSPIKTAVGYGISKVIPGIAEKAAIEGSKGLVNDLRIEGHALAKAYTTGVMDMGRTFLGRGSDISNAYGKHEPHLTKGRYLPFEASQLVGLLHDSLKSIAFRNEFERVLGNLVTDAKLNGHPVDNEAMFVLGQRAYNYAQRIKFQENNRISSAINDVMRKLDNNEMTSVQAIGACFKILLPIQKVSTNVIKQSFESSPLGLAKGIVGAGGAKMRGLDKLTPEQADIIVRNLKHGTVGSAFYALGLFAGGQVIGSFYQKYDKDKDKEIAKYNTVEVDGVRVPGSLLHLPEFNAMFMGATTKRLYEESLKAHGTAAEATLRGVGGGVRGLVDEVPGIEAADALTNIYHAVLGGSKEDMNEARYGIGNFVAGRVVPGIVRNVAEAMDQDPKGHFAEPMIREPYSRKGDYKTFGSSIKTQIQKNIPGWRNKLPNNTPTR